MSCGYAPRGEVLGHRGNIAKLYVVALQEHTALMVACGKSKVAAQSRWLVSRPPSK